MFDVHDRRTVLWFHLPYIAHRTPFNVQLVFVLILWLFALPFVLLVTSLLNFPSYIVICCLLTVDIGTHDICIHRYFCIFFLFAFGWWEFLFHSIMFDLLSSTESIYNSVSFFSVLYHNTTFSLFICLIYFVFIFFICLFFALLFLNFQ